MERCVKALLQSSIYHQFSANPLYSETISTQNTKIALCVFMPHQSLTVESFMVNQNLNEVLSTCEKQYLLEIIQHSHYLPVKHNNEEQVLKTFAKREKKNHKKKESRIRTRISDSNLPKKVHSKMSYFIKLLLSYTVKKKKSKNVLGK